MPAKSLHIEQLKNRAVSELELEIVERKGKGHPDSLIDGASESVSKALCNYYLREFNTILHHNVDKGLLVGGRSKPRFGGGEVVEPIYMVVAGRATSSVERQGRVEPVPVEEIAVSAVKNFLKSTLRFLDVETHAVVDHRIKQGSADLMALFDTSTGVPLANDTSIGVGYAPLTPTERIVLETEGFLNSTKFKEEMREVGEDIKVMGLRRGNRMNLTVAAATICSLIPDASHYVSVIGDVERKVEDLCAKLSDMEVVVAVNAGDNYEKGDYYLTVTGTSAEAGDDGNTGRGNRSNGLITPMRQYSMEATAGKNPVNHTGKIFNVLARRAADHISREVRGIEEVYVRLLSRIGAPIDEPQIASVAVVLEPNVALPSVKGDIEGIMDEELSKVCELTPLILSGSVTLF